jgi:tRNA threonylcarbamoyladenosine biosynthesis protein TsaE
MKLVDKSDRRLTVNTESLEECRHLAETIARSIQTPICIALVGTLGAGKTQWTRYFAAALGANPKEVCSPTFVLLQEYSSKPPIYHLDAYRVGDEEELLELGIEELFERDAITIIEWADRFLNVLPPSYVLIELDTTPHEYSRIVHVSVKGNSDVVQWKGIAAAIEQQSG